MTHSLRDIRKLWVTTKDIALEDFIVLTLHVLGKSREEFFKESDPLLTDHQYHTLLPLLERRLQHEPVAYLTGSKEFFGRNFLVTKHTLIPRPETECLVEDVLTTYSEAEKKPDALLDIGTGSGILALTLAQELEHTSLQVLASDISPEALAVAQKNAKAHGGSVKFLEGSFLEPYKKALQTTSVYIVANLPYVSETLLQETEPDVRKYEPESALLSEREGLAHYQALLKELCTTSLTGTAWLEISPEQSHSLIADIKNTFSKTRIFVGKDLSGRNRFLRFTF